MLKQNKLWIGLLIGLLLPFIGYAVLLMVFEYLEQMEWSNPQGFSDYFRQRTLSLAAICLNIIPLNFFRRARGTESMRGIVLATFIYAAIWMYFFGKSIDFGKFF